MNSCISNGIFAFFIRLIDGFFSINILIFYPLLNNLWQCLGLFNQLITFCFGFIHCFACQSLSLCCRLFHAFCRLFFQCSCILFCFFYHCLCFCFGIFNQLICFDFGIMNDHFSFLVDRFILIRIKYSSTKYTHNASCQ